MLTIINKYHRLCSMLLKQWVPRYITDKLQRLPNAAARLVTATQRFDHGLSFLLHDELHWLYITECIHYKLRVTVHRCLHDKALTDC